LGGGQGIVEDDPLGAEHFRTDPYLIRLSGADIEAGIDMGERLRNGIHRIHFTSLGKLCEF
jgi:hypothetical protein